MTSQTICLKTNYISLSADKRSFKVTLAASQSVSERFKAGNKQGGGGAISAANRETRGLKRAAVINSLHVTGTSGITELCP